MAGSRREKIGSILSRMTGLLRSGALKEEERPIWYDVVKALPPKPVPPRKEVPNILYPEDFIRVRFYRTFVEPGACILSDNKMKSIPQRFVDKYLELHAQKKMPNEKLFDETVRILKEEGVRLVTREEKQAADRAKAERLSKQRPKLSETLDESWTNVSSSEMPETTHHTNMKRRGPQVDMDDLFKKSR